MWGGMRKKIILTGVIAVFMFLGVFSYQTWFAVFVATKLLSGRTDGKQGIARSIIIPWRSYRLHLHHWFLALIIGGVLALKGLCFPTPEVFYGALSAVVFQGIYCYEDWYRIIRRRKVLPSLRQPISLSAGNDNVAAESPATVGVTAS
jgi:hypothetical protein